jgi:hypothetical protein
LTRDEAREYFKKKGLSYQKITSGDICVLVMLLNKFIKKSVKNNELSMPVLVMSEKIKSKYSTSGTLKECFLFINSDYFTRRECISFNREGFIGFAGWSSDRNIKPILKAFIEWCDYLAGQKENDSGECQD